MPLRCAAERGAAAAAVVAAELVDRPEGGRRNRCHESPTGARHAARPLLAAATSAFDESRGYVFTWDLLGQEELARIPEPSGASLMSFADQGEALVLAGMDQATVSVWDARSGSQRFAVQLEGRLTGPPRR